MLGNLITRFKSENETGTVEKKKRTAAPFETALRSFLAGQYPAQMEKGFDTGAVRGSACGSFCGRRRQIANALGEAALGKEPAPAKRAATVAKWNIGTALHELYQNNYLAASGLLVGQWKCQDCNQTYGDTQKPVPRPGNGRCLFCGVGALKFVEPEFYDAELDLRGHCDGFVSLNGEMFLLEMKSIDGALFSGLVDAKPEHKAQAMVYCHYFGLKQILLVYIDKNAGGSPLTREFVVPYDEALFLTIKERIVSFRSARAEHRLCGRVCQNTSDENGKYCPAKHICWEESLLAPVMESLRHGE